MSIGQQMRCDMQRKHWAQIQKDVTQFGGIFANAKKTWPSGHIIFDIVLKAKDLSYQEGNMIFKFEAFWNLLERSPKFSVEAEATSVALKTTNVSIFSGYSTSVEGESIDLHMTGN